MWLVSYGLIIVAFILLMAYFIVQKCTIKVPEGSAVIIKGLDSRVKVKWSNSFIVPALQYAELINMPLLPVNVKQLDRQGLITKDSRRVNLACTFNLKINTDPNSIIVCSFTLGSEQVADLAVVTVFFDDRFVRAMAIAVKSLDYSALCSQPDMLTQELELIIGKDLDGFELKEIEINSLELTPQGDLDPNNIFDVAAIKRFKPLSFT